MATADTREMIGEILDSPGWSNVIDVLAELTADYRKRLETHARGQLPDCVAIDCSRDQARIDAIRDVVREVYVRAGMEQPAWARMALNRGPKDGER